MVTALALLQRTVAGLEPAQLAPVEATAKAVTGSQTF